MSVRVEMRVCVSASLNETASKSMTIWEVVRVCA